MQEAPLASLKIRVPPHNLDAEMALLGSIMLRPDAIYEIMDTVSPRSFYFEKHRTIYEAMLELFGKHDPIDLLSLSARLKEKGLLERIGGTTFLTELASVVPSSANIKHYAEIVEKKSMMRELIEASEFISHLGFDESGELAEILEHAEKKIFSITQHFSATQNFQELRPLLGEAYERFNKLSGPDHELRGVPTGIKALDNVIGGFQKSDLIILAARPSIGKTALALDMARKSALEYKTSVGIFSLEMSADQLTDRIVSAQSHVNSSVIRKGIREQAGTFRNDTFSHLERALQELNGLPIYIDDQAGNSIMRMRSAARKLKIEKNLQLLIIDYLQLIAPSSTKTHDSMVQQVTEISRGLKQLARELEIPVLALSQLSRAAAQTDEEPKLHHLRDSGSIEQDADLVIFIHANKDDIRDENDRVRERQKRKIIIAKHRNGPLDTIDLNFHGSTNSFEEVDRSNYHGAAESFESF